MVWELIAQLMLTEEAEKDHLRILYLKQLQMIDYDGGIKLKAFGIPITHVKIIQIVVGTATILLMTSKE